MTLIKSSDKKMKYYAGIDPSLSASGVIVVDENGLVRDEFLVKSWPDSMNVYLSAEQRIIDIFENIINPISDCSRFYIEDVGYMSKDSKLFERVALIFMVRCFLFEKDLPFKVIAPKSLKKWTTGNGNADKNMMKSKVEERWGIKYDDDNLADAFGLARMALQGV